LTADRELPLSPCAPDESTLTSSVAPVWRSRMKTSVALLVSPDTKLVALLENATNRPSAEIEARKESAFPSTPEESTLTSTVDPVWRSCTKTSDFVLVSPRRGWSPLSRRRSGVTESAGRRCSSSPGSRSVDGHAPVVRRSRRGRTSGGCYYHTATRSVELLTNATNSPCAPTTA
jgi:hypothetical protein